MEKEQIREIIAKRVAMELKDGDVVNLGIGLPTAVPDYLPEGPRGRLVLRQRHLVRHHPRRSCERFGTGSLAGR